MSTPDENPYAAPQSELSSSSSSVPLAQEVMRRNRFPNLSTKYLRQVNRANTQLFCLEILYFLAGVLILFYLPIGVLLIIFGFGDEENGNFSYQNLVSIFVLVLLVFSLFSMCVMAAGRFRYGRISGMILDGMTILILVSIGLTAITENFFLFLVALIPAYAIRLRYLHPELYGKDRIDDIEIKSELFYRDLHQIQ